MYSPWGTDNSTATTSNTVWIDYSQYQYLQYQQYQNKYTPPSVPSPSPSESNLRWLDRRVKEMQVRL